MLALAAPSAFFLLRGFIMFDKHLCGAVAPPYGYGVTWQIIPYDHKCDMRHVHITFTDPVSVCFM